MAAGAAAALALSLFLPWYSKSFFAMVGGQSRAASDSLSAFGVFSFVEAAVLLVAGGVLYLIYARAQRRGFHLPGGDGVVVFAAGVWAVLLLIWRLFDKPDVDDPGVTVGIAWGFLFAFVAAGALAAAGARLKAAHVPEPPNPAETEEVEPRRRRRRRPADPSAVTEVLRDRPSWKGEPPEPPGRARPAAPPLDPGSSEDETRRLDDGPDHGEQQRLPEHGRAPEPKQPERAKPPAPKPPPPPDRLF